MIVSESLLPADAITLQLVPLQPLLYLRDGVEGGLMMNSQEVSVYNAHTYRRSTYIFYKLVWERLGGLPAIASTLCAKGF